MSHSLDALQRILTLSREMRDLALDANWDEVRVLETERIPLIERCFPLEHSVRDEAVSAAEMLEEIIELDKSVLSLASASQQDISESLDKLKLGKQANNAYSIVGRGG